MVGDFDTIVVGGGVVGAAAAYHLKRLDPDRSILLIDRNKRLGEGNTARSAALYRNVFSSRTSQLLATSSIRYYETLGDEIQLDPIGYLWLFSKDQWEGSKAASSALDMKRDRIDVLGSDQVRSMLNIRTEGAGPFPDISKGLHCHMCGSLSGMALAQHYGKEFRSLGGEVKLGSEVGYIQLTGEDARFAPWSDVKASSVVSSSGEIFPAKEILFACGAWSHQILSRIGIFSGVLAKKRQLFGIKVDDPSSILNGSDPSKVPAMILPAGGAYIKPMLDRRMMLVGLADELGQPFGMADPDPDPEYFELAIRPVLSHYFPDLKDYELKLKWAGYYAYHWPDKNPVVERVSNIFWASGTSGSGIMKADALGRIAASKLLGLKEADLFDGSRIVVDDLSLRNRNVEMERFVI
jgi:glycine/D-amino acid oxidase-like deaminating enzyme